MTCGYCEDKHFLCLVCGLKADISDTARLDWLIKKGWRIKNIGDGDAFVVVDCRCAEQSDWCSTGIDAIDNAMKRDEMVKRTWERLIEEANEPPKNKHERFA